MSTFQCHTSPSRGSFYTLPFLTHTQNCLQGTPAQLRVCPVLHIFANPMTVPVLLRLVKMNPTVRLEGERLVRRDHHTHCLRRGRAFRGGRGLMDSVECVRASEFPQHLLGESFFSSLGKEWDKFGCAHRITIPQGPLLSQHIQTYTNSTYLSSFVPPGWTGLR